MRRAAQTDLSVFHTRDGVQGYNHDCDIVGEQRQRPGYLPDMRTVNMRVQAINSSMLPGQSVIKRRLLLPPQRRVADTGGYCLVLAPRRLPTVNPSKQMRCGMVKAEIQVGELVFLGPRFRPQTGHPGTLGLNSSWNFWTDGLLVAWRFCRCQGMNVDEDRVEAGEVRFKNSGTYPGAAGPVVLAYVGAC